MFDRIVPRSVRPVNHCFMTCTGRTSRVKPFTGRICSTVLDMHVFAETFNKEVLHDVLCEKPIILVKLLLELRIVVIQDSEDGKRTVCKKCVRKIVNCYKMFAELREALAGGRVLQAWP